MAEYDGTIFIGAENGLYELVGDYLQKIEMGDLAGGYVSSISADESRLILTIYGKGLFIYNRQNGQFSRLEVKSYVEKYLWSGAQIDDKFATSYYVGMLITDISQQAETIYLDMADIVDDQDAQLTEVAALGHFFFGLGDKGLLRVDANSKAIRFVETKTYFPKISKIEKIYTNDAFLFVAGRAGVYKLSADLDIVDFIAFTEQSAWPVSALFVDKSNTLWAGAGGIYLQHNAQLRKADFLQPYLSPAKIAKVVDILQTIDGRMLISSGQQDIVFLPEVRHSINYLSINNAEFPNAIYGVKQYDSRTSIIASDSGYHSISNTTGELQHLFKTKLDITQLAYVDGTIIDLSNCNGLERNSALQWQLITNFSHKFCGQNSKVSVSGNFQTILYQTSDSAYVDIYGIDGRYIQTKQVPNNTSMAQRLNNSSIAVVNDVNQLLIETDGVWIKADQQIDNQFGFSCMQPIDNKLFICTSGSGLQIIDVKGKKPPYRFATKSTNNYIRDVEKVGNNLLIASNKGLELYDLRTQETFLLGPNQGIFDKDFSHGGINRVSQNRLLIQGDKTAYLIEPKLFIDEIKNQTSKQKKVKFAYVAIDGEVDRSALSSQLTQTIPSGFQQLQFYAAMDVINDQEQHGLQYKINDGNWRSISASHGLIDLSYLHYGNYILSVRGLSKLNNTATPIESIAFVILPPFYLNNLAKNIYVGLFILFAFLCVLSLRRYTQKRQLESDLRVKNKLLSLKSSSDMMERILNNKEVALMRVSHEIRTPLMLIIDPLKSIAKKISDADILDEIDVVERNAQRVSYLVDQLIEIEKFSSLRDIPHRHYDIQDTCVYLVESIKPMAEQKGQSFKLSLKATGRISLLQDTLQQIFYNLLSNAIKYSDPATTIKIATSIEHGSLLIKIKDHGPGFSESEKVEIFKQFTRLDNTQSQQGLGLGLALLRQLVKANQGYIEVESKQGEGACFIVRLPMSIKDELTHTQPSTNGLSDTSAELVDFANKAAASNMPVMLIAEDNHELVARLQRLFAGDFLCFIAKDGAEALKAADVICPNVLLTDYSMPKLSGIQLIEKLRSKPTHSALIIYIFSAVRDPQLIEQSYELGIDDFILKPFDLGLLKKKVLNRYKANTLVEGSSKSTGAEFLGRIPKFDNDKDQKLYLNLRSCLDTHLDDQSFSKEQCAKALFVSERQLHRKLKDILDLSFTEVLKQFRIDRAKEMLRQGKTITDTAYDCGFSTPSYFSTTFKALTGQTPSEFILHR